MAGDPYKYFRIEARELIQALNQGVLELEKGAASREVVAQLLRMAHTLKGAARVVKQPGMADLAHAMEEALAPHREGRAPVPRERVNELFRLIDAAGTKLAALDPAAERPSTPVDSVRVEIEEVDELMERLAETSAHLETLRADPRPAHLQKAERELAQARDAAFRLRLLPADALFSPLERAVRDASQSLQKRVEFAASGGEHRLDAHVLAALREALLHVVRNSVAHGIESESERIAAEKPPVGRVELRVERRGNRTAFVCRDDGRGIDLQALRETMVRRGFVAPTDANLLELILKGGLTTTREVTEVSGRGIGLDVVRETVGRLRGTVEIRTERGRGTTVEACVPISLLSMETLAVEASGIAALVPLDSVRRAALLEGDAVLSDGRRLPVVRLADLFGVDGAPRTAVVIRDEVALAVDRLLGLRTAIVRPLPSWVEESPVVAGVSISPDGTPEIVLDPAALASHAGGAPRRPERAARARPKILVVDDSLTTRMLERSILESAGFEVELAVSGEEGLAKARERRYSLYLVDIEMPGMDGFAFLRQVGGDGVPAMMVTSRSSPEDRRRSEECGARGYIVKSEFDQGRLLRKIGELIG